MDRPTATEPRTERADFDWVRLRVLRNGASCGRIPRPQPVVRPLEARFFGHPDTTQPRTARRCFRLIHYAWNHSLFRCNGLGRSAGSLILVMSSLIEDEIADLPPWTVMGWWSHLEDGRMRDDWTDALRYRVAPQLPVEEFDQFLADTARPGLLHRLNQDALGDQAIPGLLTASFVTRWDLDQALGAFGLQSGHLLLDLACGQGAPGLWLAHQSGCDLVGIDFAEAGLRVAGDNAAVVLPSPRTHFQQGDLAATGLADSSVDAVWCGDALFFATDLIVALTEVRRVLRPGCRLAMTVCVSLDDQPSAHPLDWVPLLRRAGLIPLRQQETPEWREHLTATYAAWAAHEAELRVELPDRVVDDLMDEARTVGGRLGRIRRVLVVAEHPPLR